MVFIIASSARAVSPHAHACPCAHHKCVTGLPNDSFQKVVVGEGSSPTLPLSSCTAM